MDDSRSSFATSLSVPEPITAPVPLSGIFDPAIGRLELIFDKDLVPAALDERSWTLLADSREWETLTATVFAGDLRVLVATFDEVDPTPPQDTISYAASPPDLRGQNGLDVLAFTDFSITVV